MSGLLARVATDFGTPCYVYDIDHLRNRARETKEAFAGHFKLSYAAKSNPNISLLRRMRECSELLDISSGGELKRAITAGWEPALISFTGPGKTDLELQASVDARIGYVIVESVDEAKRLSKIACRAGITQSILLRISPVKLPAGFGSFMAGRPTPFGIDEEVSEAAIVSILELQNISVKGFHVYAGTQCLKPDAIVENYRNCVRIFRGLSEKFHLHPEKLVFGSGLGIPYHDGDVPLDLTKIGEGINSALLELRGEKLFANTDLVLELGRYLIGEAGHYLTRIITIKHSRGAEMCICDGGMNHHLAASGHLGSVIPRNYRMFKVGSEQVSEDALCSYELAGPLCTSIDRIGRNVKLPTLGVGDVIAIKSSGAYGLTSSPVHFISHALPKEIMAETINGVLKVENISENR